MFCRTLKSLKHATMVRQMPQDPLVVVLGATGTGKSQLAIDLATQFNGEIINGDAMQMYDGLPIITNKVTDEEQRGIPHHLLGLIALDDEPWRVGLFKEKAAQIIKEIRSRGRLPILVGGTHYYTQSLLFKDELVTQGNEDPQSELSNEATLRKYPILGGPTETMHARLKEVDPVMAGRWHPNDRRKIRRSLEIYLVTGQRASDVYHEQKKVTNSGGADGGGLLGEQCAPDQVHSTLFFWVHSESQTLKARLDLRVSKMLQAGLLDEVKSMDAYLQQKVENGVVVEQDRGIWVSIGFKEFEQYLAALKSDTTQNDLDKILKLSIERVQAATRQYSNRQVRWIRLKLINTLTDANSMDRLFLLDGTDIDDWSNAVLKPASKITADFLAGEALPSPVELSKAAAEELTPREIKQPGAKVQHLCQICSTTTYTEIEWQKHLQSRSHRARVKTQLKKSGKWKPGIKQRSEDVGEP